VTCRCLDERINETGGQTQKLQLLFQGEQKTTYHQIKVPTFGFHAFSISQALNELNYSVLWVLGSH
jgi:hypothetical protein